MKENVNKFCGARLDKIKSFKVMQYKQGHNFRKDEQEFGDNINFELSHLNNVWYFNNYQTDLITTYNECLKRCKKKPRKDHIKAFEYLFYRSDCFDTQLEYDNYREQTIKFLQKYFEGCPFCIVEHNDEKIQHFHVFVIPCKEKDGEYKFVGSDYCGKKKDLSDLQTQYAKYCEPCGLRRGKEKSFDKHIKIAEYYAEQNKKQIEEFERIRQENEQIHQQMIDEYNSKFEVLEQYTNSLDYEINKYKYQTDAENYDNAKRSILQFKNELDEILENDDGSYIYNVIRHLLERFKQILIENNVIKIGKEKSIKQNNYER